MLETDALDALRLSQAPSLVRYAAALALTGLSTMIAVAADREVAIPNLSLIFVLPVVITAVLSGWGPSLLSALAGVLAFNYFLIEPRYTLRVEDPANGWALVLLLVVGSIVSGVASAARRRAEEAAQRVEQASVLQRYGRDLVAATDVDTIAAATANVLARLFHAPSVVLLSRDGALAPCAVVGDASLSPPDLDAARWSLASRTEVRAGVFPADASRFDFWPEVTPSRREAVLGVGFEPGGRPAAPEDLIGLVSGYLNVALDRQHFASEALEARIGQERERLQEDLLAAVSHDLKTPLSTVLFAIQSLQRFGDAHDPDARTQLLELAEAETLRLTGLVGNLLDMNRIDHGALGVKLSPMRPVDIAEAALQRAKAGLAERTVLNEVAPDLPMAMLDPALAEAALSNVLENAAKYSPRGSRVRITANVEGDRLVFEVSDEGPGFSGPIEPLFERFSRGVTGDNRPPGTGLGLTIARDFFRAQGGHVHAGNRQDRPGAWVRLIAPLAPAAGADR